MTEDPTLARLTKIVVSQIVVLFIVLAIASASLFGNVLLFRRGSLSEASDRQRLCIAQVSARHSLLVDRFLQALATHQSSLDPDFLAALDQSVSDLQHLDELCRL